MASIRRDATRTRDCFRSIHAIRTLVPEGISEFPESSIDVSSYFTRTRFQSDQSVVVSPSADPSRLSNVQCSRESVVKKVSRGAGAKNIQDRLSG